MEDRRAWRISMCKQLGAERSLVCKFVQKHLGCPRVSSDGVIRQHVSAAQIEAALVAFTHKYVLCAECHLPELNPDGTCRACGHHDKKKNKNKSSKSSSSTTSAIRAASPSSSSNDNDNDVPGLEDTMKQLYALRDGAASDKRVIIDRLLEDCWACNTPAALVLIQAAIARELKE
jgi:hypothetical protein